MTKGITALADERRRKADQARRAATKSPDPGQHQREEKRAEEKQREAIDIENDIG